MYLCNVIKISNMMTAVSSKRFAINQERFDSSKTKTRVYYKPDEDFYGSITIDELHRRVKEDVHQWYKERNENKP